METTINAAVTRETLSAMAKTRQDALKAQMQTLPKDSRYEKKAMAIAVNMSGHCVTFPKYQFNRTGEELTAFLYHRVFEEAAGTPDDLFADYREACDKLPPEEKGAFMTYSFSLWMIHNAFYRRHMTDYRAAQTEEVPTSPEDLFADRVILTTIGEILAEWKSWWNETGILPCAVGYWEAFLEEQQHV